MQEGAKGVDRRCRQAAAFLSDMPSTIENFASVSSLPFYKESKEADNQIDQKRGMLMDMFFRDPAVSDARSVMDAFLQLKPIHFRGAMHGYSLVVSRVSSYHELCSRACSFPPFYDDEEQALENAKLSALAWLRMGTL